MCYSYFLTKLLTLAILFSTAVTATVVANFVILGISILTSFILVFRVVLVPKLSGILSSVFLILALYTCFLKTSFFTTSLSLLKSTGTGTIYQYLIYLLHFSNCINYLVPLSTFYQFTNLSTLDLSASNLSTLDFKLAK